MLKRILAGGLSAALTLSLLTGCEAPAKGSGGVGSYDPSGIPTAAQEDVDKYLTGGSISCQDTVMKVNDVSIPAGAYFYWMSYYASYLKYYYESSGGEEDFNLDMPYGDTTYGKYVQEETQNTIVSSVIAAQQAQERGITLSDEAVQTLDNLSENMDPNNMMYYATDLEGQKFVYTNYNYTDALKTALFAKGGEYHPGKATLKDFRKENVFGAKHILLMTSGKNESEKEKVRKTAQGYLDEILKSDDKVSTFDQIMAQHSEDTGLAQYPDGYTFMTGDMVPEFENAVKELEVGDITPELVESTYGYHIIMRIDPDEEQVDSDTVKERYEETTFNTLMDDWSQNADVTSTDALKKLDLNGFFGRLTGLQSAIDAANLAKSQAESSASGSANNADKAASSGQ